VITDPVLLLVGEIGMARPVDLPERLVVRGTGIRVPHKQGNRHPGRLPFKDTRQDLHLVWFSPGRGDRARSRPPPVEQRLDIRNRERESRRAPVDHHPDRGSVALPKRRDAKRPAEGVHSIALLTSSREGAIPVKCRNWAAAWRTNISVPGMVWHPEFRAILRRGVSGGV